MNKNFILLLSMTALLFGCSAPATPSQAPIASSTEVFPTLTSTPLSPTATEKSSTPTLTPEPALRTNGPYFAYFRQVDHAYQLVMMDADGGGRKVIDLPKEVTNSLAKANYQLDARYLSPDGKWLAFYTGSAGNFGFGNDIGSGPFDLTLNLLDLRTGQTSVITPLLSKDYPSNFTEAEKQINKTDITSTSLKDAFLNGITQAHAWSLDGQYLAFAGQMDGLSSDLYLYDVTTKKIRRLSSGDEELQWIEWSPNGKWIIHGSVYSVGEGMTYDIYAAAFDGSSVKHLVTASGMDEWLDSHSFIVNDSENGWGSFEFRLIDIESGSVHKIWDGPVMFSALNSNEKKFSVFAHMIGTSPYVSTEPDPSFVPGLYLIDLKTFKKTYIEALNDNSSLYSISAVEIGKNIFAFINQSANQDSYFFSKNGQVSLLGSKGIETVRSSPDASHWIAITHKSIEAYSSTNAKINSIVLPFQDLRDVQRATFEWQPDSSGLILISGTNIYFVNIATGETKLVETNFLESFLSHNYIWINN